MKFKEMHKAVQFYQEHGMRVMPTHGIDKKCQHKFKGDDFDCEQQCWGKVPVIEHWPEKIKFEPETFYPGCNLALILGKQLDGTWLVGFDIDGKLDVEGFLDLPKTLMCETLRGRHLVYKVPPDTPLGNWNDILSTRHKELGYKPGYEGALDLKYCRGAMVSPPSRTKEGTEYKWKEWREPALIPDHVIRYLIGRRKRAHPSVKRYPRWSLDPRHYGLKP